LLCFAEWRLTHIFRFHRRWNAVNDSGVDEDVIKEPRKGVSFVMKIRAIRMLKQGGSRSRPRYMQNLLWILRSTGESVEVDERKFTLDKTIFAPKGAHLLPCD